MRSGTYTYIYIIHMAASTPSHSNAATMPAAEPKARPASTLNPPRAAPLLVVAGAEADGVLGVGVGMGVVSGVVAVVVLEDVRGADVDKPEEPADVVTLVATEEMEDAMEPEAVVEAVTEAAVETDEETDDALL